MDRADPLGLGIPGSLKIITYQTLTHTLKNVLGFNYSGVCCLTVIERSLHLSIRHNQNPKYM